MEELIMNSIYGKNFHGGRYNGFLGWGMAA